MFLPYGGGYDGEGKWAQREEKKTTEAKAQFFMMGRLTEGGLWGRRTADECAVLGPARRRLKGGRFAGVRIGRRTIGEKFWVSERLRRVDTEDNSRAC